MGLVTTLRSLMLSAGVTAAVELSRVSGAMPVSD
jgi:hypothetical protein